MFFSNKPVIFETKIAYIGLGKLGMPCAEACVKKGFHVTGYDITERSSNYIDIKPTIQEAVADRHIVFIAVPTPHEPGYDGREPTSDKEPKDFDYTFIKQAVADIDELVDPGTLIAVISTMLPGTVRSQIAPLVKNGKFIYNPYLIAQGTVIEDMKNRHAIYIPAYSDGRW